MNGMATYTMRSNGLAQVMLAAGLLVLGACDGTGDRSPAPTTSVAQLGLRAECSSHALGDSASCLSDIEWRNAAIKTCEDEGLALSEITYGEACGAERYTRVAFTCCPTPTDAAPGCESEVLGGPSTCRPDEAWEAAAADTCTTAGLQLGSVVPAWPCGDGSHRVATVTCCEAGAEPSDRTDDEAGTNRRMAVPAPGQPRPEAAVALADQLCVDDTLGTDTSCREPAEWADLADALCRSQGSRMGASQLVDSCGDGSFRFIDFSCCPTDEPVDVSAGPTFFDAVLGGDTLCKDEHSWLETAAVSCKKWGAELDDAVLSASCGAGMYTGINYTCREDKAMAPGHCSGDVVGGDTCRSIEAWDAYVETLCGGRGGSVAIADPVVACGDEAFRSVKFQCCAATHE